MPNSLIYFGVGIFGLKLYVNSMLAMCFISALFSVPSLIRCRLNSRHTLRERLKADSACVSSGFSGAALNSTVQRGAPSISSYYNGNGQEMVCFAIEPKTFTNLPSLQTRAPDYLSEYDPTKAIMEVHESSV